MTLTHPHRSRPRPHKPSRAWIAAAEYGRALGRIGLSFDLSHAYSRAARYRCEESGDWQQVIERTTGRKTRPLPKHDPAQARLL
jgi:hypothetical protein